jgi:4-hydroxy-tetrahydrodipicolinate synthase
MRNLEGSITALVTPFKKGRVDEDAFSRLVVRQAESGTVGVVAGGTTGESATLSSEELRLIVELSAAAAKGRCAVIAGAGSNSTAKAVELANLAEAAGADALLAATGYYNKPSQAGLVAHFTALHDATTLPIVIYNVPGRTVSNLSIETIASLSRLPRIVGLKDATADLSRVPLQSRASDPKFIQLSGEDMTAVGFNAMGGRGCIGVTANVVPELCARMQTSALSGDFATARKIQDRLAPLHDVLFKDTSPGPVKYALSLMGLCTDELRLPLVPPPPAVKDKVRETLIELGVL